MKPTSVSVLSRTLPTLGLFVAVSASAQPASPPAPEYPPHPDTLVQPGVPQGKVTQHRHTSRVLFPGVERDYWVYVPAQIDPKKPACLMVFQDGAGYQNPQGPWKVPTVFDNLIHKKQMPVTVGLFVNPGVLPAASPDALPRQNRSYEYDGMGATYARYLIEELIPEVAKTVKLSSDPACRAIAGASSGAIAAFNAAWERPDAFSRVFSTIGTYVGLRGGDEFETLVRKTEPKPLRVFLQDGNRDLDIYAGDWWTANQAMLTALRFAGYEVKNEWGTGGHDGKHGSAILPDALRWLWAGFPAAPKAGAGSRNAIVRDVLVPDEPFRLVAEGFGFTEGPAVNARGELFFSDVPRGRIHKLGLDGKVSLFVASSPGTNGLRFGPDGRLYGCQSGTKRVVSYDDKGNERVVAEGIEGNDLVVSRRGHIYVTEPAQKKVWWLDGQGGRREVDDGLGFANGVIMTPDQSQLYVSDSRGRVVWIYKIEPDGSLASKAPWCHLHLPPAPLSESGADGMAVDDKGRLYVTTRLGVQVCDQMGRVQAILPKPYGKWLANVAFMGAGFDELVVLHEDRIYKRKTKTRGVRSFEEPVKPPPPNL